MKTGNDVTSAEILEEAIAWSMAIREGDLLPEEEREFEAWLRRDAQHRQVWTRLQESLGPLHRMRSQPVSGGQLVHALKNVRASRREFIAHSSLGAFAIGVSVVAVDRFLPLSGLGSAYWTATAQRRQFKLPDGSGLTLNARSRADLAFGDEQRGLQLGEGMACVDVTAWGRGVPAFALSSGPARVEASAGRILLSALNGQLRAISAGADAVLHIDGGQSYPLGAGQGYSIANGEVARLPSSDTVDAASWTEGRLVLHDRPLSDLLDALRPYRAGILSLSERAASLRISGVFDLDSPDETLNMLVRLFPIAILKIGSLFARVDLSR